MEPFCRESTERSISGVCREWPKPRIEFPGSPVSHGLIGERARKITKTKIKLSEGQDAACCVSEEDRSDLALGAGLDRSETDGSWRSKRKLPTETQ
jgi:hypothetical protein